MSLLDNFVEISQKVETVINEEAYDRMLNRLKEETASAVELATVQRRLDQVLDALGAAKTMVQKLYDQCRLVSLPSAMETEGLTSFTVPEVGRVTLQGDLYASLIKDKQEAAFEWMSDVGLGDLVKPTLNSSSLKALAKERLKAGEPLPEEFFKITPFTRAQITKV